MWNILIVNCITNSCIWNTCVTWQGIDYNLPEDDTTVSNHVGVCEHQLKQVQEELLSKVSSDRYDDTSW